MMFEKGILPDSQSKELAIQNQAAISPTAAADAALAAAKTGVANFNTASGHKRSSLGLIAPATHKRSSLGRSRAATDERPALGRGPAPPTPRGPNVPRGRSSSTSTPQQQRRSSNGPLPTAPPRAS